MAVDYPKPTDLALRQIADRQVIIISLQSSHLDGIRAPTNESDS